MDDAEALLQRGTRDQLGTTEVPNCTRICAKCQYTCLIGAEQDFWGARQRGTGSVMVYM